MSVSPYPSGFGPHQISRQWGHRRQPMIPSLGNFLHQNKNQIGRLCHSMTQPLLTLTSGQVLLKRGHSAVVHSFFLVVLSASLSASPQQFRDTFFSPRETREAVHHHQQHQPHRHQPTRRQHPKDQQQHQQCSANTTNTPAAYPPVQCCSQYQHHQSRVLRTLMKHYAAAALHTDFACSHPLIHSTNNSKASAADGTSIF